MLQIVPYRPENHAQTQSLPILINLSIRDDKAFDHNSGKFVRDKPCAKLSFQRLSQGRCSTFPCLIGVIVLDASESVTRSLYSHPLTYVLAGGVFVLVWMFESAVPAYFYLWLTGLLFLSVLGILGIQYESRYSKVSLILLGAGVLGLYGLMHWLPGELLRDQMLYRTLHLRGIYGPGGTFRSHTINNRSMKAKFYLSRYDVPETNDIPTGKSLSIRMTADVVWPYDHEGFSSYLRRHGFLGLLKPRRIHQVSPGEDSPLELYRGLKTGLLRQQARWPRSVSFLRALVLGEKQALDSFDRTVFKRLGIIHLFVISGLHVGLFFGLIHGIFRWLSDGYRLAVLVMVLVGYMHFLGWPVSATRAGLMLLFWQGAEYFNRRTSPWSYLWTAVLLMILWEPSVVQHVGFQLTVSAVIGIYAVMDYARELRGNYGLDYALVSTGAFLGVMPVVLYHFHYIPSAGLVFSFLAMYLFPIFLGAIAIQALLISLQWTVPADYVEAGFRWGMDWMAHGASRGFDITVAGVWPATIVLLGLGLWWTLDHTRSFRLRLGCLGGVLLILTGVITSEIPAHGELGLLQDDVPFYLHKDDQGNTVAILPPQVRMESYHIGDFTRQLHNKGIRHLDHLISDYPREIFENLGPEFTVGQYTVHWRESTEKQWAWGRYDFDTDRLSVGKGQLFFRPPKGVQSVGYSPSTWVGYIPDQYCFIHRLERLSESAFDYLQNQRCKPVVLGENSQWFDAAGQPTIHSPRIPTVEQSILRLFAFEDLM